MNQCLSGVGARSVFGSIIQSQPPLRIKRLEFIPLEDAQSATDTNNFFP